MSLLNDIREKIARRDYEYSKHAVDQSIVHNVSVSELEEVLLGACEVIEDYPDDKYGPSCLILGVTETGRPLHVQITHSIRLLIRVITVYQPDPRLWIDCRIRKVN